MSVVPFLFWAASLVVGLIVYVLFTPCAKKYSIKKWHGFCV